MTLLEFEVPFLAEIRLLWQAARFRDIMKAAYMPALVHEFNIREPLFEMLEQPDA